MDMARSEVRKLADEDYTTGKHPRARLKQARERNYQDFLIVDVDAHHSESESYKEVLEYIENPGDGPPPGGDRKRGARSPCSAHHRLPGHRGRNHRTSCAGTTSTGRQARQRPTPDIGNDLGMEDAMGVRLFLPVPGRCCSSGCNRRSRSSGDVRAYIVALRAHLAVEPRIISMLYLPFNDPEAATRPSRISATRRRGRLHGDLPRYKPVHDKRLRQDLRAVEEMRKPIAFPRL